MKSMIVLSLTLFSLSGCATDSQEIESVKPIVDTFCSTYIPVYTSRQDTEETKAQVDKNNAVYLVRCSEEELKK